MAYDPNITPEFLGQLFVYNAESGALTWRERTDGLFKREQDRLRWNTCFAGKEAGGIRAAGHRFVAIGNKSYLVHRIIWIMCHGALPDGELDHINGDPADNRLANLRDVSHRKNMKNRRRAQNNTSGATAVFRQGALYRVRIENKHIGYFKTLDEAVVARDAAHLAMGYASRHGKGE